MNLGKSIIFLFVMLVLGSFTSVQAIAGQKVDRKIKIGLMFKFEERYDGTVEQMVWGVETALAQAKAKYPHLSISLVKFNHQSELDTVFAACKEAIVQKVDVVIGGEDSNHAMVMSEILGKAGIPFITPTATNPKVTEKSDRTFAMSMTDSQVAKLLAAFFVKDLAAKKIGVLRGVSSPYTDFLSSQFSEEVRKLEQKIPTELVEERFVKGHLSFVKVIEAWKKLKISHVAMLSYESSFVQFWNQAKKLGYTPVYLGADGWGDANIMQSKLFAANPNSTGTEASAYQTAYWRADATHDTAVKFRKDFVKIHKIQPNAWAAVSYDAALVLLAALDSINTKNLNGDLLRDALIHLGEMEVATSKKFHFSKNRSPIKSLAIYKLTRQGVTFDRMVP